MAVAVDADIDHTYEIKDVSAHVQWSLAAPFAQHNARCCAAVHKH
jgi:hypothetical protein